jgi:membrane protein DedA with SNARE-associated domain
LESITSYLDQYGYIVLFVALLLEMIALPVPGEILMSYTGYLVYQNHLNWFLAIFAAGFGTSMGMTISYWIGSILGGPFIKKYGSLVHLGPKQMARTSSWFNKYGNKVLIIAYFIPGIRHITGYFSGLTRVNFRSYAIYAYAGAFFWAGTFISIGKLLGPKWDQFHNSAIKYLVIGIVIIALGVAVIYAYRKYSLEIKGIAYALVLWVFSIFKTRIRTEFVIVGTAIATLGFAVLMIKMIQFFLGNEFQDFNGVVNVFIPLLFNKQWSWMMDLFLQLGTKKALMTVIILTIMWILWKGKDKTHEVLTLFILTMGGELYEVTLRTVFNQVEVNHFSTLDYVASFPSDGSIMILVVYGFAVYMLVRHSERVWIHTLTDVLLIVCLLLIGASHVFFGLQQPSDIAGGFSFGGVWLGLNILLLEMFRLL